MTVGLDQLMGAGGRLQKTFVGTGLGCSEWAVKVYLCLRRRCARCRNCGWDSFFLLCDNVFLCCNSFFALPSRNTAGGNFFSFLILFPVRRFWESLRLETFVACQVPGSRSFSCRIPSTKLNSLDYSTGDCFHCTTHDRRRRRVLYRRCNCSVRPTTII